MTAKVSQADLVITTAAIPGKLSPRLITKDMLHYMKKGSVIVDLAAERGGNVEGTVAGEKVYIDGVTVIGYTGHPGRVPVHASQLDRKSTRLNSSHVKISYAVFCLKKKKRDTHCNSHST